jgi:hypothetical protein
MTMLYADPRYQSLARMAAHMMNADHDSIVAAILAQWTCEQPSPAPWGPIFNNPGNLTSHIGNLDGQSHSVGRYIGGGAYLYRYASPQSGALAYSHYLTASLRYRSAIRAAQAGDARTFLTDVCNAGYGTRLACCLSILPHITLSAQPVSVPRWTCLARAVNVRRGPGTNYPIVGTEHAGNVVSGTVVTGGRYSAGGRVYNAWLRIGENRYTARAYYRSK